MDPAQVAPLVALAEMASVPWAQFEPGLNVALAAETQHGATLPAHCLGEKHFHCRSGEEQSVNVHDCVMP